MAQIMIGNQRVSSPEQFSRIVEEQLKQQPAQVRQGVCLEDVKAALRQIVAEWKADGMEPELTYVTLASALADFAGAIGLTEDDVQELMSA